MVPLSEQIRKLLGQNSGSILKAMRTAEPVELPLACALDVFCNVYNTDEPAEIGDVATVRLPQMIRSNHTLGMVVSMDEFLELLAQVWMRRNACDIAAHLPRDMPACLLACPSALHHYPSGFVLCLPASICLGIPSVAVHLDHVTVPASC